MGMTDDYLSYPLKKYGMDHDRYDWSMLSYRSPVSWPSGARIALWVNVSIQHYPLNQNGVPFKVPGGMTMPYPDLRHFTLRDFGNRVGVYRFFKTFEKYGIRPTYAVNAIIAQKYPYLLHRIMDQDAELMAHGWNMDTLHYKGMTADVEKEIITRTIGTLSDFANREILGWLSPARSESFHTPDLLKEAGIAYFCDWINDDMPYYFRTNGGALTALPLCNEWDDRFVILNNLHSEKSYVEQVKDAFDFLQLESENLGGRIMSLSIHPWVMGHAHRIKYLEEILEYMTTNDNIWMAHAGEIYDFWRKLS